MSALPVRSRDALAAPPVPQPRLRVVRDEDADPGIRSGTDESLNLLTHAVGFVLSIVACGHVCMRSAAGGDIWLQLACLAYGVTMMMVFGASTLSHGRFTPRVRHLFRTLDQVSIFLFIAASCGPYVFSLFRDPLGIAMLTGTWALALAGVGWKLVVKRLHLVPVWYYVLVAWFPATCLIKVGPTVGWAGMTTLLLSGAAFMSGTWYLCNDHRRSWYHAVWHVLVIVGTGLQYATLVCCVLPAA